MLWVHFKTIFSFSAYHRLAQANGKHLFAFVGYLYLLSIVVFYFFTGSFIRENLPIFLKNFPQVTFEQGVLAPLEHPAEARLPQSQVKIVFDSDLKTPPSAQEMVASNTLAIITGNQILMPGSEGLQTRELPKELSFTTSQENLAKEKDTLAAALSAVAFIMSLFMLPLGLLFGFCLAGAVGFFFSVFYRHPVPRSVIFKWAIFMLGPLCALWYVRLWVYIPLFTLAQVILCVIYMQQIFNTIPEGK